MPEPLFPELPQSFEGITDEDLAGLVAASRDAMAKIRAQDAEFLGDLDAPATLEAMKTVVFNIRTLEAEQATRVEAQQNLAGELAAMAATVTDPEPEPDPSLAADDGDPVDPALEPEPVAEPVAEPVIASGDSEPPARQYRRVPPAAGRHVAVDTAEQWNGMTITASANVEGFRPGEQLDASDGPSPLNRALLNAIRRNTSAPQGFRDEVIVASADIRGQIPEYRRLRENDGMGNEAKVRTLTAAAKQHGVGYDGDDSAQAEALAAYPAESAPPSRRCSRLRVHQRDSTAGTRLIGRVCRRPRRHQLRAAPPSYSHMRDRASAWSPPPRTPPQEAPSRRSRTLQRLVSPELHRYGRRPVDLPLLQRRQPRPAGVPKEQAAQSPPLDPLPARRGSRRRSC